MVIGKKTLHVVLIAAGSQTHSDFAIVPNVILCPRATERRASPDAAPEDATLQCVNQISENNLEKRKIMATTPVQNALTALIPIKAAAVELLRQQLIKTPIDGSGLDAVGTVHFARIFVFQPGNTSGVPSNLAAIITTYDGDFAAYIQAFVDQPSVAAFFDSFLGMVDDPAAADLVPVTKNADDFAKFVQKYDNTNPAKPWGQWYSAYPGKTVQNILHPTS